MCIARGSRSSAEAGGGRRPLHWFMRTPARGARKIWIAGTLKPSGQLPLMPERRRARAGAKPLPAGVTGASGGFERGEAVKVVGPEGQIVRTRPLGTLRRCDAYHGQAQLQIEQLVASGPRRDHHAMTRVEQVMSGVVHMAQFRKPRSRADLESLCADRTRGRCLPRRTLHSIPLQREMRSRCSPRRSSSGPPAGNILAAMPYDHEAAKSRGQRPMLDRMLRMIRASSRWPGVSRDIAALARSARHHRREWTRPNGLLIQRVRVGGTVLRRSNRHHLREPAQCDGRRRRAGPEVGNPVILRAARRPASSAAIHACLVAGLWRPDCARGDPARAHAGSCSGRHDAGRSRQPLNVIVPRGGRSLVERCRQRREYGDWSSRRPVPCVRDRERIPRWRAASS